MNNRRQEINNYIQQNSYVTISQLEAMYPNISAMTIRRDLEYLESEGLIVRVHGGAKSIKSLYQITEDYYFKRATYNIDDKTQISKKAASLIGDERFIYIDSGTTAMCLAQNLPEKDLIITTSAPNIALELVRNEMFEINIVGGYLNPKSITMVGPKAIEFVKNLNFDMAFLATSGFSVERGFTNGNEYECELKRTVINQSKKTIILADSTKYEHIMPYSFAQIGDIDILVVDDKFNPKLTEKIKKMKVEVL